MQINYDYGPGTLRLSFFSVEGGNAGFTGQSSQDFNFGTQRNAKYVSGLTHAYQ